jgi:hypothetical protein
VGGTLIGLDISTAATITGHGGLPENGPPRTRRVASGRGGYGGSMSVKPGRVRERIRELRRADLCPEGLIPDFDKFNVLACAPAMAASG